MRRREFHRRPNGSNRNVVLPGSRCGATRGTGKRKRHKNENEDRPDSCEREGSCSDDEDQVGEKRNRAEKITSCGPEPRANKFENFSIGKENSCGDVYGEGGECRGGIASAKTDEYGVDDANERQPRPNREGAHRTDLMFWRQERIVAQGQEVDSRQLKVESGKSFDL